MILLASSNKKNLFYWKQNLAGFPLIHSFHSLTSLTKKLACLQPDILLLDYELPGFKNPQSVVELIRINRGIKIIVFSPDLPDEVEWKLFKAGIKGCCSFNIQPEQIKHVIDVILNGELWMRRILTHQILSELVKITHEKNQIEQAVNDLLTNLTHREHEIAMLVGRGESNKSIAQQLAITERTVKAHLTEIFRKLQISDRIKLALIIKDAIKIL